MKKLIFTFQLLLVLFSVSGQDPDETSILKAMHSISSHDMLEYVRLQCDDKYEGRLTGTPGYQAGG